MKDLGYDIFEDTRVGKYITIKINENNEHIAKQQLDEICKRLLINPNIEEYNFKITKI